jgi:hypothetical protein
MALADWLQHEFTGRDGKEYRGTLLLEGYGASVLELEPEGAGHTECDWSPGSPAAVGPLDPGVWPATGSLRMADEDGAYAADIQAAGERGTLLLIERRATPGAGSYGEYVRLWVDPGQGAKDRNAFGGVTSLSAFDGLGDLSQYAWEEAWGNDPGDGTGITTENVPATLTRLLAMTGHTLPLRLATTWESNAGPVGATDWRGTKYAPDEEEGSVFCDHVLNEFTKSFYLRVWQRGGYWWAVQVELLGGSYDYEEYDADYYTTGAAPATGTHNPVLDIPTGDDEYIARDDTGEAEVLLPLKEAAIGYAHGTISDKLIDTLSEGFEPPFTLGVAYGWSKFGSATVAQTAQLSGEGVAGQFIGSVANGGTDPYDVAGIYARPDWTGGIRYSGPTIAGGGGNLIGFSVEVNSTDADASGKQRWVLIEFKVGSYYLQEDGTWTLTPTALFFLPSAAAANQICAKKSTAEIPASGQLVVNILTPVEAHNDPMPTSAGVQFDNMKFDFYPGGETEAESTTIVGRTAATGYALRRELETIELGDGPTDNHLSSLLTGGGAVTGSWGRGASGSLSLQEIILETELRLRASAHPIVSDLYNAETLPRPIEMEDTLRFGGADVYVHAGSLRRVLDLGTCQVRAVEFALEAATIDYTTRQQKGSVRSGGSTAPGSSGGGATVVLKDYNYLRSKNWNGTLNADAEITGFSTNPSFAITGQGHVDIFDGNSSIQIGDAQPLKLVSYDGADVRATLEEGTLTTERDVHTGTLAGTLLVEDLSGTSIEVSGTTITASPDGVTFHDVFDASTGEVKIPGPLNHDGAVAGFYGAAPVTRPAGADQAAVTLGNADNEIGSLAFTAPAAFGNTDNEIGGLAIGAAYSQAEVQALRDKTEELADDCRALRATVATLVSEIGTFRDKTEEAADDLRAVSALAHALRSGLVSLNLIKGSA